MRQGLTIGNFSGDLVAAVSSGVRFYKVNPSTRMLSAVNDSTLATGLGEGLCMYQSPTTDKVYGFSITIQGILTQYEIRDTDNDGLLETSTVRTFDVGSEAEGCVADDDTGALYVSQEDAALWRYTPSPRAGQTRESVDVLTGAGGHLANDVEGVTLVDQANGGGYVIVSSQNVANPNASYFNVYERGAGNDFVDTFRVANGTTSDDCDRTDGITAVTANLGSAFPNGMFVCQDNNNDLPGTSGNQNMKMVKLENVVDLGGITPPPPPPPDASPIAFVGKSTVNASSTAFTTTIPSATKVGRRPAAVRLPRQHRLADRPGRRVDAGQHHARRQQHRLHRVATDRGHRRCRQGRASDPYDGHEGRSHARGLHRGRSDQPDRGRQQGR